MWLYLSMVFVFCGQPTPGIICTVLYLTNRPTPKKRRRR